VTRCSLRVRGVRASPPLPIDLIGIHHKLIFSWPKPVGSAREACVRPSTIQISRQSVDPGFEISVPEGKEADLRCGCGRRRRTISGVRYGSVKGFIEDLKRLIEEICCAAERHVNLLEGFFPSPFLV
jgi:hypothetical protein